MTAYLEVSHKDEGKHRNGYPIRYERTPWWVRAHVYQLDTHAHFSAVSCVGIKDDATTLAFSEVRLRTWIEGYCCDIEVFSDLIRRDVIQEVHKAKHPTLNHWDESSWRLVRRTLAARFEMAQRARRLYLFDEPRKPPTKWWKPDERIQYLATVDKFSPDVVNFHLQLERYRVENLVLPRDAFYEMCDRLRAKTRFSNDWSSLDETTDSIRCALMTPSSSLHLLKTELEDYLDRLGASGGRAYEAFCVESLRYIEKFLRLTRERAGYKFRDGNLDLLITGFEATGRLQDDESQMLRLVAKPYRDFVLHGHAPTTPVSKLIIATCLSLLATLGRRLSVG